MLNLGHRTEARFRRVGVAQCFDLPAKQTRGLLFAGAALSGVAEMFVAGDVRSSSLRGCSCVNEGKRGAWRMVRELHHKSFTLDGAATIKKHEKHDVFMNVLV